jgi:peptidyl-prolyl cis-trans isomerase SurA
MRWHGLGAAAAALAVAAGCQATPPDTAGGTVTTTAARPATVERSQKPDGVEQASFSTLLDRRPEASGEQAPGQVIAAVRATVNGVPILEQEVNNASFTMLQEIRGLPEPERSRRAEEIKRKALDLLIERELVIQEVKQKFGKGGGLKVLEKIKEAAAKEFDRQVLGKAKKQLHIKSEEELANLLRAQGTSLEGLRRTVERQYIAGQYMAMLVQPYMERIGHEEIREYYDGHPEEFQTTDNLQWQDIFIATAAFRGDREQARQFAEGLRERVRKGEDFVALARQYDSGTSHYQNGKGLGERRGDIRPREVEPYLFDLKSGEVGPVVELQNGFHVIRVAKREYAGRMPFNEETQEKIRKKLQDAVFERESKRIAATLRSRATIEIARTKP